MADPRQNFVLVTGAEGFLGRIFTALLEGSGERVIALDSLTSPSSAGASQTVRAACDIRNKAELENIFRQNCIDRIVHLAAILPTAAQKDPAGATEVNIAGSLNLLALGLRYGLRRMVFASSLSVYGTCAAGRVVSEEERAAPQDLYGAAKLYIEQQGRAFAASSKLEFLSLRIGRVVGPGARSTTSAWRSEIFELLQSEQPASVALPYMASERVLLAHVEDAARALLAVLRATRPAHTVYNAPCESWVVGDLKRKLESLNPKLRVTLGEEPVQGNPRSLDFSRFQREFAFTAMPLSERLLRAAGQ